MVVADCTPSFAEAGASLLVTSLLLLLGTSLRGAFFSSGFCVVLTLVSSCGCCFCCFCSVVLCGKESAGG